MANTILIVDPAKASRDKAAAVVAALGYEPAAAADAFEAHALIDGALAVIAVHPTAEPIYPRLRTSSTPLVLSLSPRQPRPAALAAHLGADAFVLRPYRRDTLAIALYAATAAGLMRDRALRAETALAEMTGVHRTRQGESGLLHIDLFKTLLPLEIRRARRHGYDTALCVVALDPLGGKQVSDEIATLCQPILRRAVRDVDLAVRYGDGRFLLFLPHTDQKGASTVGNRIVEQVRSYRFRAGGTTLMVTASVGIATHRKGFSFARMVRDAHAALRAAQLKGGDRAIVR